MTTQDITDKITAYEQQLEVVKAQVYRLDGIIGFLRFELSEAEKVPQSDTPSVSKDEA